MVFLPETRIMALCVSASLALTAVPWTRNTIAQTDASPATWSLIDGDCGLRIVSHTSCPPTNRTPQAEHFKLSAGYGSQAFGIHSVTHTPIISELSLQLQIKSDKAGLQLMVRAVLPRSVDDQGAPATLLIAGPKYLQVGQWETLKLTNLPQALDRHLRVLRSENSIRLDPREAYIDLVAVNVYGGKGRCQVWLATPQVDGAGIQKSPTETVLAEIQSAELETHQIRSSGSMITIDSRPFAPRLIRPRGESWEFLKRLGFNTIWLTAPATADQMAEAESLGLWLVAPPPTRIKLWDCSGHLYRRVLAWDLAFGGATAATQTELAHRLRTALGADRQPLVGGMNLPPHEASRLAQVVLHQHPVHGTPFSLAEYAQWLGRRRDASLLGTTHWTSITTELPPALVRQMIGLSEAQGTAATSMTSLLAAEPEQLWRTAMVAVASGSRGICVSDSTRLDQTDPATRLRAIAAQALNHRLSLMAPWIAGSPSVELKSTNHSQIQLVVLRIDQATLAVPIVAEPRAQWCTGGTADAPLELTLSASSDSSQVYLLRADGMERVASRRVAGGMHFTATHLNSCFGILLTSEPRVVRSVAAKMQRQADDAHRIRQQMAQLLLAETESVVSSCREPLGAGQLAGELRQAEQGLDQSMTCANLGDYRQADRYVGACLNTLRRLRRNAWESIIDGESPAGCPLAACFKTLPQFVAWRRCFPPAAQGVNLLPGGDFETLESPAEVGWQSHGIQPSAPTATLAQAIPGKQNRCLHLAVTGDLASQHEGSLAWVTSPPLSIPVGKPVRIDGWIWVRPERHSNQRCASISDSWTGAALAQRFSKTSGWRSFTLYRVGNGQPLVLTCAMDTPGTLLIDNVHVSPLQSAELATLADR